ncbi:MAG: ATP-dependent helicase RecG [Bacteroidota bacterium]|jgi:transcriptional regulator of met regulon|nr:ATP-dependent helicase RecG [Bacteroidota bacterium]
MSRETNRIEYKRKLSEELDLEKEVIAFPVDKEVQSALEEQVGEQDTDEVTPQVTDQVKDLLKVMTHEHTRRELQEMLQLTDREYFRKEYLIKAIDGGFVALTIPDKPNSSKQKYRLTQKGENLKKSFEQ